MRSLTHIFSNLRSWRNNTGMREIREEKEKRGKTAVSKSFFGGRLYLLEEGRERGEGGGKRERKEIRGSYSDPLRTPSMFV